MKYLIVDDEPLAIMRLQKMLQDAGITDIITAENGQDAIDMVKKNRPEVIFLDIEMPVMGGIEAAAEINKISPKSHIVFCTAYDEFAIKAFDLSASDYLLKPVSRDRLKQSLDKVSASIKETLIPDYLFTHGKDIQTLSFDDIYCFISEEKTTFMYCSLGTVIIDDSLLTLEKNFPENLLRINRNALINTDELSGIRRDKSSAFAKLKSTDFQPQISRRKLSFIKKLLKS